MNKAKAVLFDLDGTLVNTEFLHFSSWNDILLPFNVGLNYSDYIKEYSGMSLFKNAERLNREFELGCSVTELVLKKESLYLQELENSNIDLMPYALETVQYFSDIKIPMALVTSSSKKEAELLVENTRLQKYFAKIITRDDVINYKPHPEPYQLAASSLGYLANEYVVFEDSIPGVSSAIQANLNCYFIKNQFTRESNFGEFNYLSFENLQLARQYLVDNDLLISSEEWFVHQWK